jgi:transcriptional regulator with XRE-family HTH domain
MKTAERSHACRLRREQGLSVKELARLLRVSPSSVSLWVRDIELTEEQRKELQSRSSRAATASIVASALSRRVEAQGRGRRKAKLEDPLHIAGCMLFWAEGSRNRNVVEFVNSDPAMVVFFGRFLRVCFDVPDAKMRIKCNLFADHLERQHEVEQHWLDILELPRSCLCKSSVNVYSKYSKKTRRNKLPYGTCRIAVHDTQLVQHIYGAIQEYAGFDREEWLM